MLSVDEALQKVLATAIDFGVEKVSLTKSTGRILAEDILADRDFPPFDRVTMDGVAIQFRAFAEGVTSFSIEAIQAAGVKQTTLLNNNNCIEVMTGAVLPANTDAVVPYENCKIDSGVATITTPIVSLHQNIHSKGTDSKSGQLLVAKGQKITAAIIGVMATVGLSTVEVFKLPKIAICSTGDELVDITVQPEEHQLRRSNVFALTAALSLQDIEATLYHFPDNEELMLKQIKSVIEQSDAVVFSGAVSKGKFDFLPVVLEKLGMKTLFHTVAQRPGKPFLFGLMQRSTVIFGFPGNPASTLACYYTYLLPWLNKSLRIEQQITFASLTEDVNFKPSLTYLLYAYCDNSTGHLLATPVKTNTSGDMVSLVQANSLVILPAERDCFKKGEMFPVILF